MLSIQQQKGGNGKLSSPTMALRPNHDFLLVVLDTYVTAGMMILRSTSFPNTETLNGHSLGSCDVYIPIKSNPTYMGVVYEYCITLVVNSIRHATKASCRVAAGLYYSLCHHQYRIFLRMK